MKPYLHALSSVRKHGGIPEGYLKIHEWFDQTKAHFPNQRHRAILHSSFGIYLCEQVFGVNVKNSNEKLISVRDLGEQHVIEDMGTIPTIQDYLKGMPLYSWLGGKKNERKNRSVQEGIRREEGGIARKAWNSPSR